MSSIKNPPVSCNLATKVDYDPETGFFTWNEAATNRQAIGLRADRLTGRYRSIKCSTCDCRHQAHRVAWLKAYGCWPTEQIDHINGDSLDNSLSNLREALPYQNTANCRGRKRDLPKGVRQLPGSKRYSARVHRHGKLYFAATFDTVSEASAAYERVAKELFGEFARAA
jgi:hypothetical protein